MHHVICPCSFSIAAFLSYSVLYWVYRLSIRYTIGRVKTPNMKHPLRNLDMVTRKCLAPNSSIYWIVANIPGSETLTKPRLGLTSAPNQQRRKPLCSFSVPFTHWAQHWETECLFEVILYSELLDGNTLAFSLLHAESVLENMIFFSLSLSFCYNNRKLLVWMENTYAFFFSCTYGVQLTQLWPEAGLQTASMFYICVLFFDFLFTIHSRTSSS